MIEPQLIVEVYLSSVLALFLLVVSRCQIDVLTRAPKIFLPIFPPPRSYESPQADRALSL